jgi:sortase (surface protein transpeptidase)
VTRCVLAVVVVGIAGSCGTQPNDRAAAVPVATTTTSAPTSVPTPPSTAAAGTTPVEIAGLAKASSARWDNLKPAHDPSLMPARLVIASMGIDAPIAAVGIDQDGALDLPADNSTVAWFADGSQPGGEGAALLAAHVDQNGRQGVFFRLRDLEPGTEIRVEAADATVRTFVVEGPPINVKKSALPVDQVFRTDGPSTLVLVTCGGRFDRVNRSYEDNTIVIARRAA